jgi:hypothetical protein
MLLRPPVDSLTGRMASYGDMNRLHKAKNVNDPLASLSELSSDSAAFTSLFADVSWAGHDVQTLLGPNPEKDRVDTRLVRATMHNLSRIKQLNYETLVVRVNVKRIRDVMPPKDVHRMVVVVSLNEDTRLFPVQIKVTNRFLSASVSVPFKQPENFDFFFDGVLDDFPLYVGVHKVPDTWPENAASHQMNWSLFAAETLARQGEGKVELREILKSQRYRQFI